MDTSDQPTIFGLPVVVNPDLLKDSHPEIKMGTLDAYRAGNDFMRQFVLSQIKRFAEEVSGITHTDPELLTEAQKCAIAYCAGVPFTTSWVQDEFRMDFDPFLIVYENGGWIAITKAK